MEDSTTAEGAAVAFCGVVLNVLGLNYMKHAGRGQWLPWRMSASQASLWGLAFLAWAFGQALQVVGLWLAPESVVAVVANAACFVNALVASRLFGEPFRLKPPLSGSAAQWLCGWDLLAVALLTLGACLVVVSAPALELESYSAADEVAILAARPFGVAVAVSVAAGGAAAARVAAEAREPESGRLAASPPVGLAFGVMAGVSGALSFTATKLWLLLASSSLAGHTSEAWRHPVGWAMLLAAGGTTLTNMVCLFAGMASQEALVVIPCYYIVQTLLTAVQELALFSLYPELLLAPRSCVLFLVGIALCVWGVYATGYREPPAAGASGRPAQLLDGGDAGWSAAGAAREPAAPRVDSLAAAQSPPRSQQSGASGDGSRVSRRGACAAAEGSTEVSTGAPPHQILWPRRS